MILTLIAGEYIFTFLETSKFDTTIAITANTSSIASTSNESDHDHECSDFNTVLNPIFIETKSSRQLRLPIQRNIFNWCLYSTVNNNHFLKRKYMSDINNKPQCSFLYLSERNPTNRQEFFIFVENVHVNGTTRNQDRETRTGRKTSTLGNVSGGYEC